MPDQLKRLLDRRNRPAWAVLIVCLLLVLMAWYGLRAQTMRNAEQQFELHVRDVVGSIEDRLRQHEQLLRGGVGLFDASDLVSRAAWRAYVARLALEENYPGIQGVGYSQIVRPAELPAHIAVIRAEGFSQYTVRPPGERPIYTPIIYLEPFSGRNLAAFGFDMISEATRAKAMRLAAESGKTAITGKVKLVQETQGKAQAGFLMYLPVYRKHHPLTTPAERWQALQGFVFSPYRVNDLMHGILGERVHSLDFMIFDGRGESGEARIYASTDERPAVPRSAPPLLSTLRSIHAYGHEWTVRLHSRPDFEASLQSPLNVAVPILGVGISVLLFVLMSLMISRRERAEELAGQMTGQLRDSELRSRTVLDNVLDGIITINEQGMVESFNRAAERIFGYPADEVIGRNVKMLMPEPYHSQHDIFLSNYISSGVPKIIGSGREVVGLRKDGTTFPMDLAVTETWLEGHHIFTGIVRDISQRKLAEETIARTSRLNQEILDGADYSIISTDMDGIILTFNRAAEEMLGYRADELVGTATPALFHDGEEVLCRAQELTAEGFPVEPGFEVFVALARRGQADTHEWAYIRKDGSRFPVLLTVTALHDGGGAVSGFLGMARDISEQKKVEQALRESSASLMRAQQIAHIGNWDWNIETGGLRWSDEIYRIFGLQPQPFGASYEAFLQAVHPDDRALVEQAVNVALSERTPYSIDHRIVLPDGRERVVHEQGEVIVDESGKPVRMLGTVQDITERKRNENELRKLSRAVEQSPVSVLITDAKGNIEYVNTKFSEVTCYAPAEVIGKNPRLLQSGLTPPETYRSLWQTLNEGGEWRGKLLNRKKNGELFWEEAYISAIRNSQGRVTHYIGVKEDITERMRIEEDLARANRQTELILEAVEEGIYGVDLAGNIAFVNPSAARMLGYGSDELLGRNSHAALHHSRVDGSPYPLGDCAIYKTLIDGTVHHVGGEVFWRKDGTSFPVDFVTAPMREGEKTVGAVVAFRDITESQKIELMKSEFISTVSHELRTPLTSIRGSLGLIAGGVAGELTPQLKALVDIAHKNSERLIMLVNDILDIEKIESGKMPFDMKPLVLVPLIEQALEVNRAYGDQFNVIFKLERPQRAVTINADAGRLMQVMANLLSNAAKFSPAGGTVNVSVQCTEKRVRISVADHGQGIPEEFRSKIFQKFSQADSSDTRKKGGSGLGLSISKVIVEQMGGSIGFDSKAAVGTTFFVELPEWQEQSGPGPQADVTNLNRILICEDNRDTARLLQMMLKQGGFDGDIACSAAEAQDLLGRTQYRAITLDIMLPGQGGMSLLHDLHANEATRDIPIIVVSAKAGQHGNDLESGSVILDWLDKPIDETRLMSALRRVTRQGGNKPVILHVEDDTDIRQVLAGLVGNEAELVAAPTLADAKAKLEAGRFDLIILDLGLPDGSGVDLLPFLNERGLATPVMIFSAGESSAEIGRQVAAALVKARTSNEVLLATIKQLIGVT